MQNPKLKEAVDGTARLDFAGITDHILNDPQTTRGPTVLMPTIATKVYRWLMNQRITRRQAYIAAVYSAIAAGIPGTNPAKKMEDAWIVPADSLKLSAAKTFNEWNDSMPLLVSMQKILNDVAQPETLEIFSSHPLLDNEVQPGEANIAIRPPRHGDMDTHPPNYALADPDYNHRHASRPPVHFNVDFNDGQITEQLMRTVYAQPYEDDTNSEASEQQQPQPSTSRAATSAPSAPPAAALAPIATSESISAPNAPILVQTSVSTLPTLQLPTPVNTLAPIPTEPVVQTPGIVTQEMYRNMMTPNAQGVLTIPPEISALIAERAREPLDPVPEFQRVESPASTDSTMSLDDDEPSIHPHIIVNVAPVGETPPSQRPRSILPRPLFPAVDQIQQNPPPTPAGAAAAAATPGVARISPEDTPRLTRQNAMDHRLQDDYWRH